MNPCSWVGLRNSRTFLPYSPGPTHAREGLLPIDAKFPHDSFERVVAVPGLKRDEQHVGHLETHAHPA